MERTNPGGLAIRVAVGIVLGAALLWIASCGGSRQESDQEIQQQAQQATERAKVAADKAAAAARVAAASAERDANDIAKGVKAGLHNGKGVVNVNSASRADLEKLPGITSTAARRIAENRPYKAPHDMVNKGAISQEEYDRIAGSVVTH